MLREASKTLGDEPTPDPETLLAALQAGLTGIQRLGAAVEGDKTMVDALSPALTAMAASLRGAGTLDDAVRAAAQGADEGAKATVPMEARKGRASYLGPRSVGHQDPGATSTALLLQALVHVIERPAS
jgi:dihydroxyacetone kinase-like protein